MILRGKRFCTQVLSIDCLKQRSKYTLFFNRKKFLCHFFDKIQNKPPLLLVNNGGVLALVGFKAIKAVCYQQFNAPQTLSVCPEI